jgi:hypothetical protein
MEIHIAYESALSWKTIYASIYRKSILLIQPLLVIMRQWRFLHICYCVGVAPASQLTVNVVVHVDGVWDYVSELRPVTGLLLISRWCISMDSHAGMIFAGDNQRKWRKTCPSATLPITNPTKTVPGANPGLRGERPATNRLSHGMDEQVNLLLIIKLTTRGETVFLYLYDSAVKQPVDLRQFLYTFFHHSVYLHW